MLQDHKAGAGIAAALAGVILLAAGACGGGGDESTATPTTTPAPTPTASPTVPATLMTGPGITETDIRLGMTNDLTGAGDTPYAAVSLAMTAYFRKINIEDGGVCARNIALVVEDDRYNPETALAAAKQLIEQGNVVGMVGLLGTAAHQLVGPYLNDPNGDSNQDDGVPDMLLSSGWKGWGDAARYPWTIGFIPDYGTDAAVLAEYVNEELAGARVGVLYELTEFGVDYLESFKAALSPSVSVVAEQSYDLSDTSFSLHMTNVQASGAEVVLIAATPEYTVAALKAAQALSYDPQYLLSYVNAPSTLASLLGGGSNADALLLGFRELDGSVSTAYLMSTVEDEDREEMAEHARIMETYSGPPVSALSVYGQALAETMTEGLRIACRNGDLTRAGIFRAVLSIEDFQPSLFLDDIAVDLSATDHRAVQALQPIRIQADGNLELVGDVISVE